MMAIRDGAGPFKMRLLLATLMLICTTIPLRTRAETVGDLMKEIEGGSDIECYVCNSASVTGDNDGCSENKENIPTKLKKSCNNIADDNGYLLTVYGMNSIDTSLDLAKWPPSLSELAKSSPNEQPGWMIMPGFPSTHLGNVFDGTTPAPISNTTAAPGNTTAVPGSTTAVPGNTTVAPGNTTAVPGNTTAVPGNTTVAPGNTTAAPAPANDTGSFSISSLSIARLNNGDGKFTKGYQSCRTMKVWTEPQKNDGYTQQIMTTTPTFVRTCSFMPYNSLEDGYKNGCKTIKFKTGAMEVCYCDGKKEPCNKSTRLQVSSVGCFLAALLLVVSTLV